MTESEKAVLKDYRFTVVSIYAINKQMDMLRIPGEPAGLKAVKPVDAGSGTNDPVHAALQLEDGLREMLEGKMKWLRLQTEVFEKILARVEDASENAILRLYYALGYSDAEIAKELELSRQTVWNRRRAALEK